jgi:hypothetical protein
MIRLLAAACLVVAGCHNATGKDTSRDAAVAAVAVGSDTGSAAGSAVVGQNAQDYVPAEFKDGMARWKDVGVYVDGKPIGFLTFGELPITLAPTWIKTKLSLNKPAGCPSCPSWKWTEDRYYKFNDYLKAQHIDPASVNVLHAYGPKLSQTIAVTGHDLTSSAGNEFRFHFGTSVAGKPIPHVPPNFGNGKQPDKITGVMIYIHKKPPIVTPDGIELDGVEQLGVPYYGEPLRGGVRIYLDDKLAVIIKRQELDVKKATKTPDGELNWSFGDYLASSGVDTKKLVEGWIIRDDRRQERIAWADLQHMTFSAGSKAHGGVLIGADGLRANAIALHTRAVQAAELPVVRPGEGQ